MKVVNKKEEKEKYLEEKKKLQEILRLLKDIRKIVKFKRYNFA